MSLNWDDLAASGSQRVEGAGDVSVPMGDGVLADEGCGGGRRARGGA